MYLDFFKNNFLKKHLPVRYRTVPYRTVLVRSSILQFKKKYYYWTMYCLENPEQGISFIFLKKNCVTIRGPYGTDTRLFDPNFFLIFVFTVQTVHNSYHQENLDELNIC